MSRPPKYPASKVIEILSEVSEGGYTIESVCAHYEISIQTYYRWKQRFGDLTPPQAKLFRKLLLENGRLKSVERYLKQGAEALEGALALLKE